MSSENDSEIRKKIKLTQPEQLYQIKDKQGNIIDLEQANGQEISNHCLHSMTTYDDVLNNIRNDQGYVTDKQHKQAVLGAADQVLLAFRDEHIKVVKDAQHKGKVLKDIFQKVGVATATALSKKLDNWSDKIKDIAHLESSQRSLQTWNDTYRVQRELIKELLKQQEVSPEIISQVNKIYSTRSVNKAAQLGSNLFKWEESQTIKLIKSVVKYGKLQGQKNDESEGY